MSQTAVKPGDVVAGKYRVERVLGTGGMGYIVAARHLQLDQMVAMKFLRHSVTENAEAATRFLREARAAVKLRNEHIAKVFDVGTLESGDPYIVMEYLDGSDLAKHAKERHVLPVPEAADYVIQACEALAEAHALGIIHRDVKLANLFVTRGPTGGPLLKVLDFGISKTNPFNETELDMTRSASMLGSPRFMSPEQMRDPRAVDRRSDIWSLGVVLYRLVCGRAPFEAATLGRLLTMVMHEEPAPLATVRPELPRGLSELVMRCLEKDPARRFSSVAELAEALVPFTADPVQARPGVDRIFAIQNAHPMPPLTGSGPNGPMPVNSPQPLHPHDSWTAAPWTGTHGVNGKSRVPPSTIGLALALCTILIGSGIYAKISHDSRTRSQTVAATATPPEPIQPAAAPVPAPVVSVAVPVAPPLAPPAPAKEAARPAPPQPKRVTAPAPIRPHPAQAAARPTSRSDDGIPTTRE